MSLPVEPKAVEAAIVRAAATEVMPRFRALARSDIQTKSGPNDLVTAADLACEAALTRDLTALLPNSLVVGEEATAADPALMDRLAGPHWCWIIDPVDGTHNFAHGREGFAVIVALMRNGVTQAGWIHDPLAGVTAQAVRGQGAWRGDRRLEAARPAAIERMTGVLYVSQRRAPALRARINQVQRRLGPQSFQRSAGAEYLGLCEGRIHYAIFTKLLPWDHAAGALIFAEAGGHIGYLDDRPYRPTEDRGVPLLLAPDAASWRSLRDFFAPQPDTAS